MASDTIISSNLKVFFILTNLILEALFLIILKAKPIAFLSEFAISGTLTPNKSPATIG